MSHMWQGNHRSNVWFPSLYQYPDHTTKEGDTVRVGHGAAIRSIVTNPIKPKHMIAYYEGKVSNLVFALEVLIRADEKQRARLALRREGKGGLL